VRDKARLASEVRTGTLTQVNVTKPEFGKDKRHGASMEMVMPEQSSMHLYLNWAKERIDEMDAALASLEVKASHARTDSKVKVDQIVADLKKRRDEFQALLKTQAEAGEGAWERAKTDLERQWNGFEAQVKTYFESAGKQIEQQQVTFKDIAAAQAKAWREAADKFHEAAGKVAAARSADLDAALKQMKSDASEAEARLQKVKQAGSESWSVLSAALAESRKAFDQANQPKWIAPQRLSNLPQHRLLSNGRARRRLQQNRRRKPSCRGTCANSPKRSPNCLGRPRRASRPTRPRALPVHSSSAS
jgi:hypothetical protein